jgi:hypothetical protein
MTSRRKEYGTSAQASASAGSGEFASVVGRAVVGLGRRGAGGRSCIFKASMLQGGVGQGELVRRAGVRVTTASSGRVLERKGT